MLIERQRDGRAETMSMLVANAQHGHDWALTVQCPKALQLVVRVSWAGGVRDLVDQALAVGVHDIVLPSRIAGRQIEVLATPGAAGGQVAAALSWTPDPIGLPEPERC